MGRPTTPSPAHSITERGPVMRVQFAAGMVFLGLAAAFPEFSAGDPVDAADISWKRIVVDRGFHSEGVALADVNRDGKPDILAGDVWSEAPHWTTHAVRPVRSYGDGAHGYSRSFACWADDLNGDGWPDVIVINW